MWLMNVIKSEVEHGLTFKFTTQAATKVALWWFGLGPRLGEYSLEGLPRKACHYPSSTMPTPCIFLVSHYCSFVLLLCHCCYVFCVCPPSAPPPFTLCMNCKCGGQSLSATSFIHVNVFPLVYTFPNSFGFLFFVFSDFFLK